MKLWLSILVIVIVGCQGPAPKGEYSLARSAIRSARDADAARFSADYWHKAMNTYRQAKKLYQDRQNDLARQYFARARVYAERAENLSQLARAKGDDSF